MSGVEQTVRVRLASVGVRRRIYALAAVFSRRRLDLLVPDNQVAEPLFRLEGETPMRATFRFAAIALGLAVVVTGCGKPTAEVAAATAAVDKANTEDARTYAADSVKAAEDARAALDAEVKAQDAKWVKSYGKTKELAAAAQAAGDKAAAEAITGRQTVEAVAATRAARVGTTRAHARVVPVRVGGQIRAPAKLKDVHPVYPAIAQSARVSGLVKIEATIGPDGRVSDAKIVQSIPLLDQSALDAVRQWEYTPTLLNGVPVPVVLTVSVNFRRS
jgi:TonB family protein